LGKKGIRVGVGVKMVWEDGSTLALKEMFGAGKVGVKVRVGVTVRVGGPIMVIPLSLLKVLVPNGKRLKALTW
jgi:hypothetical protein